jgi:energy-coupling factor transporter ATP-binding protein EcfA2
MRVTVRLFAALRGSRAQGHSIVYVSHRLSEVMDLADRVFGLNDRRATPAERLANGPSVAIRLMKRAVYQFLHTDFLSSLEAVTGPMGVAGGNGYRCGMSELKTRLRADMTAAMKAKARSRYASISVVT